MKKILLKTNKNHPAIKAYAEAVERGRNSQFVFPTEKGWIVKRAMADKVSKVFDSLSEATAYATKQAKNAKSSVFVHGKDGEIMERKDY